MSSLLTVTNLRATYGNLEVLHGISFDLAGGEALVILGANGAGKTTLIRALIGLHKKRSGEITFKGDAIQAIPIHQKARRGIIYISDLACFPTLSIQDNILLSCRRLPRSARKQTVERIYSAFPELALKYRSRAASLSGGQRKLLGAARALAAEPELLVMDEPSAGLSPVAVERLVGILAERNTNNEKPFALLLAEQNVSFLRLADRVCVIDMGKDIFTGTVANLHRSGAIERAYFG